MSTINLTHPQNAKSSSSLMSVVTRVGSAMLEGAIPFAVYMLVKSTLHTSDIMALSIGTLVPAALSGIRFARSRSVDITSLIIIVSMVGSIIAALIGGSPQLLLIRESVIGALLGIALLISLLWSRPLFFYMMRQFRAGHDKEKLAAFNTLWSQPALLKVCRIVTIVWGLGCLGEFALRVAFVLTLSIPLVLALSSLVLPAIYGLMLLWTLWYVRHSQQRAR